MGNRNMKSSLGQGQLGEGVKKIEILPEQQPQPLVVSSELKMESKSWQKLEDKDEDGSAADEDDLEIDLIENALDEIENIEEIENIHRSTVDEADDTAVCVQKRSLKAEPETYNDLNTLLEKSLKCFLNQNIRDIRKEAKRFVDPHFRASVEVITDSVSSDLAKSLSGTLRVSNRFDLRELNSKILWKKSKVGVSSFFYYRRTLGVSLMLFFKSSRLLLTQNDLAIMSSCWIREEILCHPALRLSNTLSISLSMIFFKAFWAIAL
jgi:hypothetical protein